MKTSGCDIVKDLLPLYVDDALSESSNIFVEEHLKKCKECSEDYKVMVGNVEIPNDNDVKSIKNVKSKMKRKEKYIILIAVVCTILAITIFINFSKEYSWILPYSEKNIELIAKEGNIMELKNKNKYSKLSVIPKEAKKDNTLFLMVQYNQTLFNEYINSESNSGDDEQGIEINQDIKNKNYDNIKVYYINKDFDDKEFDIMDEEKYIEKIIEYGELIYQQK